MDDAISTDDALISTDVDKLIRIISEKKKVGLGELHRLSGIRSRNALETWVRVLEDEGYVSIEYALTGTYVKWAGAVQRPSQGEETACPPETQSAKVQADPHAEEVSDEAEVAEENAEEKPKEETSPEELLDRYVKMKRDYVYDVKKEGGSVKDSIMKNLADENESFEEFRSKRLAHDEEDDEEEAELTPASLAEEESIEPAALVREEREEEEKAPPPRSVYNSDVKDLISAYMEEIKEEKAKLEQLKKKKDMLYKDELAALESRAEGELVPLMDSVLDHESRLLSLREKILELPEKVESAMKLQDELKRLRVEGRTALQDTKQKVENFTREIKSSEKEIRGRIAELRSGIEENEKKVDALERVKESIDARAEKITASIDSVRANMSDLNERMTTLDQYLSETNSMKSQVDNGVQAVKTDIEKKHDEVSALTGELDDLKKLSSWVMEYLNDYDAKISEIESYVKKSDDDVMKLREAAEAKYIHSYLSELETASEKYDGALDTALKAEKQIDLQMDQSKERIAGLVKESQKLIRKVGEEAGKSPDYDSVKKKIEERTARMKKTVDEKTREKGSLAEEIKKKKKKKD